MKKLLLLAALATLPFAAFAQEGEAGGETQTPPVQTSNGTVTISSKGEDVRAVIHDLFEQSKKSYVLEPNIRFVLFLSLQDLEFEEALQLVCQTSKLKYEIQNGIFFIGQDKEPAKAEDQPKEQPKTESKPKGKLSTSVLNKRITTRFDKIDIRELFKDLTKQTSVKIEVDSSVPGYKIDAYLINTSLKYGLDTVCEAAGLEYEFTTNLSLRISKKVTDKNRVAIHSGE